MANYDTLNVSNRVSLNVANVKAYNADTGVYGIGDEITKTFPMWHARLVITQDRRLFLIEHYQTDAKLKKGSKIHCYLNDLYLVKGSIDHLKEEQLKGAPICRVYGLYWSKQEQGSLGYPQYWFEVDVVEPSLTDAKRFMNADNTSGIVNQKKEEETIPDDRKSAVSSKTIKINARRILTEDEVPAMDPAEIVHEGMFYLGKFEECVLSGEKICLFEVPTQPKPVTIMAIPSGEGKIDDEKVINTYNGAKLLYYLNYATSPAYYIGQPLKSVMKILGKDVCDLTKRDVQRYAWYAKDTTQLLCKPYEDPAENPTVLDSGKGCLLMTKTIHHDGPNSFITSPNDSLDPVVYKLSKLTIVVSPAGRVTMVIDKSLKELELRPTSDVSNELVTVPIELHHFRAYVGQEDELQQTLKHLVQCNPSKCNDSVGVLVQGTIEEYPIKPTTLVRIRCKGGTEIYPNGDFTLTALLKTIKTHDENKTNKDGASPEVKKMLGSMQVNSFLNVINDQNFAWDLGEKAATDRKLRDSLFSFVRLVNKGCFDIILQPSEVEWLLDAVICRARETMHDEDIKRFVGMFEGLGYQFKYTTRDGWSVISLPPKVKKRVEQLMHGEVSGEMA